MKSKSLSDLLRPPRGFGLTKSGRIFFLFLFAIIIISMATGNNLLFLILACLLSFMIVSGIESEMNIRHLGVTRLLPPEIFTGIPGTITYLVRNRRRSSVRLVLIDRGLPHETGPRTGLRIASIIRGMPGKVRTERIFRARGRHRLGKVVILTSYPYGVFEKSITFDLEDEVLVLPGPIPWPYTAPEGHTGELCGAEPDSVSHVRTYSPGDAFSSIVWKKQHLGLFSRVLQGGGGAGSLLVLLPGGDLEKKLCMASYFILEQWRSGLRFGLSVNDYYSGIEVSGAHKLSILKHLALIESIGEPVLREARGVTRVITL